MTPTTRRGAITIGTRGSSLALRQTEIIRGALLAAHPDLTVEVERITTRGDVIRDRPLADAAKNDQGLFIEEIENALRDGTIDLAVHSAKDLPSRLPADMAIVAYSERADPRDALVSPSHRLADLPRGARVGTSSPRRACQVLRLRPDLAVIDIRGNVDTRLRKLDAGEYEAIVLAFAGLDRLGLARRASEIFSPDQCLPAVGQGALAVEARADDPTIATLLAPINDRTTALAVSTERAFLAAVGGGCAAAVAAHATLDDDGAALRLAGLIGAPDGRAVRGEVTTHLGHPLGGVPGAAEEVDRLGAALAADLLARGGAALLAEREAVR